MQRFPGPCASLNFAQHWQDSLECTHCYCNSFFLSLFFLKAASSAVKLAVLQLLQATLGCKRFSRDTGSFCCLRDGPRTFQVPMKQWSPATGAEAAVQPREAFAPTFAKGASMKTIGRVLVHLSKESSLPQRAKFQQVRRLHYAA